jgi:F0F1-type ATP synthase assembly protein I
MRLRACRLYFAGFESLAVTIDLPKARRLALGVVLGQAAATVAAAAASWVIAGTHAGGSALLGGGIGTVSSLAMALLAFGVRTTASGPRVLAAFFTGEIAKLALVIGLFVLAFEALRPAPGALLAGYAATFLVYWIVFAGVLPALGGLRSLGSEQG